MAGAARGRKKGGPLKASGASAPAPRRHRGGRTYGPVCGDRHRRLTIYLLCFSRSALVAPMSHLFGSCAVTFWLPPPLPLPAIRQSPGQAGRERPLPLGVTFFEAATRCSKLVKSLMFSTAWPCGKDGCSEAPGGAMAGSPAFMKSGGQMHRSRQLFVKE